MKKVFFGWYIVAAAVLLMGYNNVMFGYGFTAFMTPIAATFGWGLAQLALASSLRGVETGALDPFLGMAADRYPAKMLMLVGIGILALGAIIISQTTNLAMFFVGFLVVGLGSAISVSIVPTTVIARWFSKNIGKANGILLTGNAIGPLFTPLLVKAIDAYGWQNTMLYLAVGLLIVGIPLPLLFRDRPQDYGLLPDGKAQDNVEGSSTYDISIGAKEALKMWAFWCLGIATMFQMTVMGAVVLHLMPYLSSLGMERSTAAAGVMTFAIATLAARIPYGVLADIFKKKYIMALSLGLTAAGLVIFELIDGSSFAVVVLFAIVYGIGVGGLMVIRAPMIREYFGTKKFGTIFGLMAAFTTVGSVVGAPVAGWLFDTRGTYKPIWLIFAGFTMVGAILLLTIPPPPRKLNPVS